MNSAEVLNKEIGLRFKKLRIKSGYKSYESFAVAHGLSRMQYWRIESGRTNITIKSIAQILNIHKISFEDFVKIDPG